MWILLIPAAAIIGAWIYGASKVSKDNIPISQLPESISANTPIVVGDFIVVGKPGTEALMIVNSLSVPGDDSKAFLLASFPNLPALGPQPVSRNIVRKATTQDITRLTNRTIPLLPSGVSPAAVQAAQLESATQQNPSPGPQTIASVQQQAERARMDAINKLVPESTTPEALAALLALASLPSVGSQSPK